MFGFLNPRPHSADYRRAYARLCQHQRRAYGILSLPFHSYEAVFLYQCAVDAGAFPTAVMPHVHCCKLATPTSLPRDPDAAIGRFCASVALLLGSIKLEDDIRDSRGLLARCARWVLRKRIARTRTYFNKLDPKFGRNVEQLIADHHQLETKNEPVMLEQYVEPTALSFGYVFSLMARLPGMFEHRDVLATLGRHLGSAIIAFDCAVDWKRDRRRGEFNPLADEDAVANARLQAADRLADAEGLARRTFGAESRAAATLSAVRTRVLRMNPLVEAKPCPVHSGSVWTRARRAARFVMMPAMVSANGPGASDVPPVNPPPERSGQPPGLPGGIEDAGDKKGGRKHSSCCGNDTDDCCFCGAMSCDCCQCAGGLGECIGGADCCAGAECCACA
ncbi:MAG TPA: DUF5685 family protein [Gemmataceae bacterium]|jgi:hypothetical protein|nr:DUF5685 family protein [Gemmataceae bacterium]